MKRKYCDKCNKWEHRTIKRIGVMIQFPYYEWKGFSLCEDCEIKFKRNLMRWLK